MAVSMPARRRRSHKRLGCAPAVDDARKSRLHAKQFPLAGDPFEGCRASALEFKTRTRDERLHGCRDQDFVGVGDGRYAGARVNSDASELAVDDLALPS